MLIFPRRGKENSRNVQETIKVKYFIKNTSTVGGGIVVFGTWCLGVIFVDKIWLILKNNF